MNQVNLYQKPPQGYTQRQTNADANYHQAAAHASADPRYNAKPFDRAGSSRGAGQYSYGAAKGAQGYAENMAAADAVRMQDAYANANFALGDQARQQDFGMALSGLQENQAQQAYMQAMGQQSRAMDFTGNVFNQMAGGGASPTSAFNNFGSGLLKGLL